MGLGASSAAITAVALSVFFFVRLVIMLLIRIKTSFAPSACAIFTQRVGATAFRASFFPGMDSERTIRNADMDAPGNLLKVIRINASTILAGMMQFFRQSIVDAKINKSVSEPIPASQGECSIPAPGFGGCPKPAAARSGLVNISPNSAVFLFRQNDFSCHNDIIHHLAYIANLGEQLGYR